MPCRTYEDEDDCQKSNAKKRKKNNNMPCRTYEDEDDCNKSNAESIINDYNYTRLQEKSDAATRAACDLRTILRRGGTEEDLTPETRTWVAQHDIWDARRIILENADGTRQNVKEQALAKLTLDERRVLGL